MIDIFIYLFNFTPKNLAQKTTLEQRHTIVSTLWNNGVHNAKSLHQLTSIPRSTIYDYIKKLKNRVTLSPLPRSERPKKLSPKKCRFLGHLISANRFYTCAELSNILNDNYTDLNITDRTVLNELNDLQYFCTIPKSVPLLTDNHKQRRVEFAMKYRRQNWNKVIFSDETTLQMFRNNQKVFHKAGTQPPHK